MTVSTQETRIAIRMLPVTKSFYESIAKQRGQTLAEFARQAMAVSAGLSRTAK